MDHDFKSELAKSRKKHFIISGVLIAVIIAVIASLGAGLKLNPNKVPTEIVNKPANSFNVTWLQGQEFAPQSQGTMKLSDFKGQPVVLNFFASWCYACREEARLLEEYWQKYKGSGVNVVGIAIQDTPEKALSFARHYGKTYMLGLDEDGKAGIEYGITGVPETFFINSQGIIVQKIAGPVDGNMLDNLIPQIMN